MDRKIIEKTRGLLLLSIFGALVTGCQKTNNSQTAENKKIEVLQNQENTKPDDPFDEYKIEFNRPKEKAKIKYNPKEYDSYEDFKDFLQLFYIENDEGISFYEKDNPDDKYFAGYYKIFMRGCGTGCVLGVMVDIRDGEIYSLPMGEGYSSLSRLSDSTEIILNDIKRNPYTKIEKESDDVRYKFKEDSRLFITASDLNIFKNDNLEDCQVSYPDHCFDSNTAIIYFHVWNEEFKKFEIDHKITLYPTQTKEDELE